MKRSALIGLLSAMGLGAAAVLSGLPDRELEAAAVDAGVRMYEEDLVYGGDSDEGPTDPAMFVPDLDGGRPVMAQFFVFCRNHPRAMECRW